MKVRHLLNVVIVVYLITWSSPIQATLPLNPAPDLCIMIMLDGLRPDYLTMYNPPNLLRLVAEGAWVVEGRSVFPSMTTPNQTSFVTGALPRTTGIPNNSRYDRQLDRIISPLRDNQATTIAEVMSAGGWQTVAINHFMLEGRGARFYTQGDFNTLISYLTIDLPALLVHYHVDIDTAGHKFGPFSQQTRRAVLAADEGIGLLLAELDRLNLTERTTIVIASDHGMSPYDGIPLVPSLTQLAMQSDLSFAGTNAQITTDTDLVYINAGASYLYWRSAQRTPEREEELMQLLQSIQGADILNAAQIEQLGADPERLGDVAIIPCEGRALTAGNGLGGGHGTPQENHIMMLFWGRGIKPGSIVHRASIVDIVPTILALTKLEVPTTVDGKPIFNILDMPSWKTRLTQAGDYRVVDVAASSSNLLNMPVNAADGDMLTVWQAADDEGEVEYITLDYGQVRQIGSVEIVAAPGDIAVSPRHISIEISVDGMQFTPVYTGQLSPVKGGQSAWLHLDKPLETRYLRLRVISSWAERTAVRIAELRAWKESGSLQQ